MRLSRHRRRARRSLLSLTRLAALVLVAWAALHPGTTAAENRVTLGGNYYRERSTRVIQPYVRATVDAPDERLTLGTAYLLDAISSASIASGTMQATGGDNVFTEFRHEVVATASSRLGEWNLGTFFRYSTETDWISRGTGLAVARDFLQRTINVSLAYNIGVDRIYRIRNNIGDRLPWCGGAIAPQDCRAKGSGTHSNLLLIHNFELGYTHALHRYVLGIFGVQYAHLVGPQDNPYRENLIISAIPETHPRVRNRFAIAGSVRATVPQAHLVFEPYYSFYVDDWGIEAHAPELRIHARVHRHLRLRARYRYYHQSGAFFWKADGMYIDNDGQCTRDHPERCATADVKVTAWDSHTPGVQLVWEFDGLARHPGLGWLEGGYLELNYNHAIQHNRFGNARIANATLSFAF